MMTPPKIPAPNSLTIAGVGKSQPNDVNILHCVRKIPPATKIKAIVPTTPKILITQGNILISN